MSPSERRIEVPVQLPALPIPGPVQQLFLPGPAYQALPLLQLSVAGPEIPAPAVGADSPSPRPAVADQRPTIADVASSTIRQVTASVMEQPWSPDARPALLGAEGSVTVRILPLRLGCGLC